MKKAAVLLTGFLGMMLSSAALAEGYMGINYAVLEQDNRFAPNFSGEEFDTGDLFFRLGGDITEVFSSELRVGRTVAPKEENEFEFQNNYIVGAYLRIDYEMNFLKPYVVIGGIRGEESLEGPGGIDAEESFDDVSGGVGLDLQFGDHLGLNMEYTHYYDINDVTLRGPSAGVYWAF